MVRFFLRKQLSGRTTRVCLKNIAGDENSRFWVLTERPFSGNNGAYCPKKTRKAGVKRCIFSPVNVFQTHAKVYYVLARTFFKELPAVLLVYLVPLQPIRLASVLIPNSNLHY
jgi:hypothetical protein